MPDYFTLGELRALPDMGDAEKYPDARCEAASAYIVGIIEREVGTSFISRTATETHNGGRSCIVLDHADATGVTSVTVDGVTADTSLLVVQDGVLQPQSGGAPWGAAGPGEVTVVYPYGYSTVAPGDVKEAALQGTRAHLLSTGNQSVIESRRTTLNTEAGTINFTVAGKNQPTGYPEVDAVILAWRDRLDTDGFG